MSAYLSRCASGHFVGASGVCWHCRVNRVRRQMRYEDSAVLLRRVSVWRRIVDYVCDWLTGAKFAALMVWGAVVSMEAKREEDQQECNQND